MGKELAGVIEENGIVYCLAEDGCYHPDLGLPEGTHYHIGKYRLMRWKYFRLLISGKLNEHLYEVDGECHEMVELLIEQMKARVGIAEKLKASDPLEWFGLINNASKAAEEVVLWEVIYM